MKRIILIMKNLLMLVLATIMCVSLCACGGGEKKVYAVGKMVSTDCVELTLESFEFAETYNSIGMPDGDIFAVLNLTVKNIGKTELSHFETVDGNSYSLMYSGIPCIEYGDGYLFSYDDMLGSLDLCSTDLTLGDLKPLSDGMTVEVAIIIPSEVKNNEDNPLLVKMAVPASKGTEIFTYTIR